MAVNPFDYSKAKKGQTLDDTAANAGNDLIIGSNYNDTLHGGGGNDLIAGGNGDDTIFGDAGNDVIWGDSINNSSGNDNGKDILSGGSGDDTLHGGNGKDYVDGGANNDTVYGDNGSDVVHGGSGDDKVYGGLGGDVLYGDAGKDNFVYETNGVGVSHSVSDSPYKEGGPASIAAPDVWDIIADFTSGDDKIDLTQLNGHLSSGGITKLTWTDATETDHDSSLADSDFAHRVWSDTDGKFIYADTDGDGAADLKIQVHAGANDFIGVNHAPTLTLDSNAGDPVTEEGVNPANTAFAGDPTAAGNVLTNDTDPDGDAIKVVGVHAGSDPDTAVPSDNSDASVIGTYGTLVIHKDGTYTYTLNNTDGDTNALAQDEAAADVFTYTVSDIYGATSSTTLTVNITGTNDGPTAVADSAITDEDTAIAIDVVANDTDPDDPHTLSVSTFDLISADGATITLNGDGTLQYDPTTSATLGALNDGQSVDDTFSYTVTDEHGATSTTTVTVHVDGVSDADPGPGPSTDTGKPTDIIFVPDQSGNSVNPLGHFAAVDPDSSDSFTWSLAADSKNTGIGIDSTTGDLTIAGNATAGTHTLQVTITDPDAPNGTTTTLNFTLLLGGDSTDDKMPSGSFVLADSGNNIEAGQAGSDLLTGSNGVDYIVGGTDVDVITGLGGADVLVGGGGHDNFAYTATSDSSVGSFDKIVNFSPNAGSLDTIDFSAIAGITVDAAEAFTNGAVAANGISWFDDGTNTFVYADATGDGVADMKIELLGTALGLSASDFLHHV